MFRGQNSDKDLPHNSSLLEKVVKRLNYITSMLHLH